MRYLLVEISCLECVGPDCEPQVLLRTNDFNEARKGMKPRASSEYDTFVIDTETGAIALTWNDIASEA